jgi:hypothetical protein
MSRIITAALFLATAWYAWRRGYMAARVDAVQPYWHVPRSRVEWALRLVGR